LSEFALLLLPGLGVALVLLLSLVLLAHTVSASVDASSASPTDEASSRKIE
jgi:hypothetical protein